MSSPRNIVPLAPHHFILRGNNKRRLFSYPWEYKLFLKYLESAAHNNRVAVHALALMTNHVHLVVTPRNQPSGSRFVQAFAQRYAIARNKRKEATGKLFEQRFVSLPIADDAALARTMAYVDLNPIRAGLPQHTKWTTYSIHIGRGEESRVPETLWTPAPWYARLGSTSQERENAYAAWLKERLAAEPDEPAMPEDPWERRPNGCRAL